MLRRLPTLFIILLIVLAAPGAQAERGFFEQLLGSLRGAASAKSESVAETAATTEESEPLALQPTTTERSSVRKRSHSSRRHRQTTHRSQTRAEPPLVSDRRPPEPPAEESSAPREFLDDAKQAEQVLPATDADNVLPPAGAWPNSAPRPLAPWPVEDARADAAPAEPAPAAQAEPQTATTGEARQISMDDTEEVEPDSFLDPQRLLLAFISAAWLTFGLLMFAFRRRLARAIGALRRRGQQLGEDKSRADTRRQPLTLILKIAAHGGTVIENEKVGDAGARAVSAG